MTYTVYFNQIRSFTPVEWRDITDVVKKMFHRLKQVKDSAGSGRPQVDEDVIAFNGDRSKGDTYESFVLRRVTNFEGERLFQFCITALQPYDRFVKAVLTIADHIAPGVLDISSDGDNEDDWNEGVGLAQLYLPKDERMVMSPIYRKRFCFNSIALKVPVKDTSFDKYDTKVRNIMTKLALLKPPAGSSEKEVRKYIMERLMEYGII
jgi:hypothetical protein